MKNISKIHHLHSSGPAGFGIVTYRAGGRLGPRRQDTYQLVVIHRGSLRLSANGSGASLVRRGEGILLGPGDEDYFQFSDKTETTHSWCQVPPQWVAREPAIPAAYLNRSAACSPWLLNFLQTGWQLNNRGQAMLISAVMTAIWEYCGKFATASESPTPIPEAVERAQVLIESRLASPLTLDEIVRHAGISKGHFIKLTRTHWGMTPMAYVWQRRTREASHLLSSTGLSVSEVAYRTGFANPFHFSRKFRSHFGQHPRAWRNAEWKGLAA